MKGWRTVSLGDPATSTNTVGRLKCVAEPTEIRGATRLAVGGLRAGPTTNGAGGVM